jgi:hypothetical protein
MLHLTPLLVAGWAIALFGAATRLAPYTKPFWDFFGKKASAVLPSIVAGLPTAFAAFQNVKTWLDVVQATLITGAVLGAFALPGSSTPHNHPEQMAAYLDKKEAKKNDPPPPPSIPPLVVLCFTFMVSFCLTVACGMKGANWPAAVSCTKPLLADAIADVKAVLLSGSNVEEGLKPLADKYGPDVVLCIVNSFIDQWGSSETAASPTISQANVRAKAFMKSTGSKVSQ